MASPGRGSRAKGKSSELEVVNLAKPYFPDAARDWATPQLHGDIKGIPDLHLEVRRRETLSIEAWCREVEEKCDGRIPAVAFRRNNQPWRVALPLTDLLHLLANQRSTDDPVQQG
jgi:hypothetical protein